MCQVCHSMFFYSGDLRQHIKITHKMLSDKYLDKFEQLETKSVKMECKICGKEMKRNIAAINQHLSNEHFTSANDYGKQFNLTNWEVTYQVPCYSKTKKSQQMTTTTGTAPPSLVEEGTNRGRHLSAVAAAESKSSEDSIQKRNTTPAEEAPPINPKRARGRPPSNGTTPIKKEEEVTEVIKQKPGPRSKKRTALGLSSPESQQPVAKRPRVVGEEENNTSGPEWFQGIEYECQVCYKMFYDGMELAQHARSSHSMDSTSYRKQFKRFATKDAKYMCHICDQEIQHTTVAIEL